ncbi:uncharacterized protein VNE69_02258 [Vairimorpha necatrix]|uniref:Uncharacterized protein n=1 Tax=Vairimorpha necatrix TaxID=6039 RepID=A0AAX4J9S4_9MICR
MMFLLFYSTCKLSRDVLDLHTKTMVKTNESKNNQTVEYNAKSSYLEEISNHTFCLTTEYFSNVEVLDLSLIEFRKVRIASWHVYHIFRDARPFKKKIQRMVQSKTLRRKIFNFDNFYFYVLHFIRNLEQENDEEYPYLFLKSLAFKCYRLIYILSFFDLDYEYNKLLLDKLRTKIKLRTKRFCPWEITNIFSENIYDLLIWTLESIVDEDDEVRKKFTFSKITLEI